MSSVFLGSYFFMIGSLPYSILSFSLAGSVLAFLKFNKSPAQIFMGDTGSLLIGLVVSILVVQFINIAPGNKTYPIVASPAIGLSIILIPLLDTCRVFAIRIFSGRSPFSPDRNHIHHILLKYDLRHNQITLLLVISNVLIVVLAFLLKSIGSTILILLMAVLFFGTTTFFNNNFSRKLKLVIGKRIVLNPDQPEREIEHAGNVNSPLLVDDSNSIITNSWN